MIRVTEEAYDSEVAAALVAELLADLNERYASIEADMTEDELAAGDAEYLAEVTAEMVAAPHGTFVVAWLGADAVGCGAVKPFAPDRRVGEIKRMYTAPRARRQGISRAILRRLEAAARDLGYRRLQLETGTAQPEALALYETEGWHRITPYGRFRDSPDSVCFAKDLAQG